MATPKLTPAFKVVAYVPAPLVMTPGNENSSLVAVNGDGGYVETADGSTKLDITAISDWISLPAGKTTADIDCRMSAKSTDGIAIDMHYLGKFTGSLNTASVFAGKAGSSVDFGDEYLYTTPRVWSRSEKFAWVNNAVFVAVGRASCPDGSKVQLEYNILKVG
ncbi:hypothetical protein FAGAP_10172 [Fusarium agapanthi]|uniref:Uncharacterized protein n=1 Tax=Fusarium agapanthi TaxID=1803897 RepID=A0A9P5B199_9HYPO|nr:hypothetical protein FAGAP_10172 [Fusarium agapanthi]